VSDPVDPAPPDPFAADPADEGFHVPDGEPLWNESWYFDFVSADASLGGYVRVGRYPNLGVIWYWACLVGPDRPLVAVYDHEVPIPAVPGSLELRADGLWADHNCEEALVHWSLGLEAFAVSLDDPADVYRGAYGDRVPFGFDLEWETDGRPFNLPIGLDRYEIPCRVHGEILVGDERLELDGRGQRDHSWGVRDWWATGWCWTAFHLDDGSRWHGVVVKPEQTIGWGYVQRPGQATEGHSSFTTDEVGGAEGLPSAAHLEANGTGLDFTPTAWAPVLLTAPDGRLSRFARGMGHFRSDSGVDGVGWIEFNQPQPTA
jgi:hypothetical protein